MSLVLLPLSFYVDITLSVSLEKKEPVPTFINSTLLLSYEQKNMTYSVNIYKHILSKSQNKVPAD